MMSYITCPLIEAASKFNPYYAVVSLSEMITFNHLNHVVNHTVKLLKKEGVQETSRVGLFSPNTLEYLIILLALWRLEATAVLLSTRVPSQSVDENVQFAKCQFCFDAKKTKSLVNLHPKIVEDVPIIDINLDLEATLMFTSGSMDQPKAAVLTYGNHYFNALGSNENIGVEPRDRWLLSLPLYHVSGLSILFRTMLSGAAVVMPNSNEDFLTSIKRYKVTHVSLVPTQLHRLLHNKKSHKPLAALKAILIGGGPIDRHLVSQALELNWPIYISYGLTEMGSQVATSAAGGLKGNLTNTAKVLNYREVKIAQDGEILVKGETLFKGYYTDLDVQLSLVDGEWFATKDLGEWAENGELKVKGRKDNMFISGGENIQAEEVEQSLCQIDGIEQAIVVPVEDEEFGFRPAAFIKEIKGKNVPISTIRSGLEQKLPRFKIPILFYKWPGELGEENVKVRRTYFRQLVNQGQKDLLRFQS